jgi:peptidyl-prolyl cis-trans isomerase A (cyclophilin A)
MQVVDAIAAIPRYNGGGAFTSWPLRDYDGSSDIGEQNLVLITDIVVVPDDATVTNPEGTPPPSNDGDSGSGGGSVTWLLALIGFGLLRKRLDC